MIFAPFDAADVSALRNVKKILKSQKMTLYGLKISASLTTLFWLGTLPVHVLPLGYTKPTDWFHPFLCWFREYYWMIWEYVSCFTSCANDIS